MLKIWVLPNSAFVANYTIGGPVLQTHFLLQRCRGAAPRLVLGYLFDRPWFGNRWQVTNLAAGSDVQLLGLTVSMIHHERHRLARLFCGHARHCVPYVLGDIGVPKLSSIR
jgi:hypothetical protein